MLEIRNITKSFGGVQAIRGSDFSIQKNKVTALIGPNGAGKTTLFDIICGFVQPDAGEIVFNGKVISSLRPHDRINRGISRTFQHVRLFQYLTLKEHLQMIEGNTDTKFFRNVFSHKNKEFKKYQDILDEFGIDRSADALASELSYGQRKLLDIVMALKKDHSFLMLDEPVAGVNQVLQTQIEALLLSLKAKGETMLVIDHDMEFVRKIADHIIVLDAGVVIVEGPPKDVLSDPRVLEAYLGE